MRIHLYGYRRLTCFYACLWMCLLWGLLRSYLLLEYAIHDHVASGMALAPYIIVFVLPACLQVTYIKRKRQKKRKRERERE